MKKILAILLAAIMTLSLGVMAFAEGEEDTGAMPLPTYGRLSTGRRSRSATTP